MTPIFMILRQARERKHLSQQAVADAVNIPLLQYQKYESGEQSILSACTITTYRIFLTLDLDPALMLEYVRRDTVEPPLKAIIYASFPASSKVVSEDALIATAASAIEYFHCEIRQTVIDYSGDISCTRREEWVDLIQSCESEHVDLLIIPSILMLSHNLSDAVTYVRYLLDHYPSLNLYFLYENLYSGSDRFDLGLKFHFTSESHKHTLAQRKRNLRQLYKTASSSL